MYISAVYSQFSDRVGFLLYTIPSGVIIKQTGAEFLRSDAFPIAKHM